MTGGKMEWKMPEEVENVCLADAYMEGTKLYAAGLERNILLRYNLKDRTVERLGWFDGFRVSASCQIAHIYKFENSLFCFSPNSYEVAEYDLQEQDFRYYHPKENDSRTFMICTVCCAGEWAWMFRGAFDTDAVSFSMKKREYRRHRFHIRGRMDNYIRLNFENGAYIGTQIWRCVPGSADLVALDTVKLELHTVRTGLRMSFFMMNVVDGLLYIISRNGRNLAVYDTGGKKAAIYETGYDGMTDCPFAGVEELNGRIFLIPFYEGKIFCYEKEGEKLKCVKRLDFPKEFKKIHDAEHRNVFMKWKKTEGAIWLLPFAGNGMICLDADSLQMIYYPMKISEEDYLWDMVRSWPVLHEGWMGIREYIKAVGYDAECKARERLISGIPAGEGQAIWDSFAAGKI